MYKEHYSLCDIYKEYIRIKKNDGFSLCFTVICNNLSNRAKDFLKFKLKDKRDEGTLILGIID